MSAEPQYPIPAPENDPRFTLGLTLDVAEALERRGYPRLATGEDLVRLQSSLFRFLYDTGSSDVQA